jgi:hypothetical protein
MNTKNKFLIAISLIAISVAGRLIPHPWNMTPVAASAIFAGVKLGKRYALLVPFFAMLIGDMVIGFYAWQMLLTVYASMLLIGLVAYLTRSRKGKAAFFARPVVASIFFFLTTNAAVCFFGTMYAHSFSGLILSYISGLPFFGRDLLGNLLYTSLFFAVYEYARLRKKNLVSSPVGIGGEAVS